MSAISKAAKPFVRADNDVMFSFSRCYQWLMETRHTLMFVIGMHYCTPPDRSRLPRSFSELSIPEATCFSNANIEDKAKSKSKILSQERAKAKESALRKLGLK